MVPSGWTLKRLEDVCDVQGGKRLPKGRSLEEEDNGYPYLRVSDMRMGGIIPENIRYVPADVAPRIAAYRISSDDLFITVAGTLGLVGEVPANLDGANLTENADKLSNIQVDKRYLLYYLQSDNIQRIITSAQTQNAQPKLALTRIRQFPILVPPRQEQEKIAGIISTWDAALTALQSTINERQERKRGLMQVLLTGKKRFKEFRGLPRPEVDLDSQLERIIGGGTPSRSNPTFWDPDGIPWITVKDLRQELITGAQEHISELGLEMSSANLVPADTVIVATRMAVGKSIRCAVPAAINQDLKALFPRQSLHPHYLHLVLKSAQPQLEALASGSTVKGIRLSDLRGLRFELPPLAEQQRIASVFSTTDAEITNLEQQLDAYKLQKRGLMQQLLTGKKRVKVDAVEAVA